MAYISQKEKKEKLTKLKPLFTKYGIRATLSIDNYSTLKLNIWEARIDFISQYHEYKIKNPSQFSRFENINKKPNNIQLYTGAGRLVEFEEFEGEARQFLLEANKILQAGNFDESDSMTDYFHVGFYSEINIGNWEKPFIYNPNFSKKAKEESKKEIVIKKEDLNIVDYSQKALAIFGDTKPIKDKLKEIGARFNPFLTFEGQKQAGWIIQKSKQELLQSIIY